MGWLLDQVDRFHEVIDNIRRLSREEKRTAMMIVLTMISGGMLMGVGIVLLLLRLAEME